MIDTEHEAATIWALDFDAELPCEALHHSGVKCSGPARWLSKTCKGSKVICANAANYQKEGIYTGLICADCWSPCAECWSIRPI